MTTLAIAAREAKEPVKFSYTKVTRTPVKLPEQQYVGHQTPKLNTKVEFRPFGVYFDSSAVTLSSLCPSSDALFEDKAQANSSLKSSQLN